MYLRIKIFYSDSLIKEFLFDIFEDGHRGYQQTQEFLFFEGEEAQMMTARVN